MVCNDNLNLVGNTKVLMAVLAAGPLRMRRSGTPWGPTDDERAAKSTWSGGLPNTSDPWSRLDRTGGKSLEATRTLFSRTVLDPWSSARVYDDMTVIEPGVHGPLARNVFCKSVAP